MTRGASGTFGAQLKALREASGFTQEELATVAGLSVHAVSALERGERRRPHFDTVRALSAALDLSGTARDALLGSARATAHETVVDELSSAALPMPPTVILGRAREMDTLRQWLADSAVRLVTIVGPGGVGKSRLAVELARAVADEGVVHAVFVPLAAIRDPAFVPSAIAEALGLTNVTAVDLPQRVRTVCADRLTLLVLDNFEQVLDAAPIVAALLASVASLRLLVTSRAALRVRGEREFAVGPLAMNIEADATSPADVARAPAVRLFIERVRDVQSDFRLTRENAQTVTAICRRLDALPLALELAAPWIKVLAPDELLRRLTQDVLRPTLGPRDLPERQRTMNATVAWSYQLLDPSEQRAFRRLGVLPGRFGIDAAAAVFGGASDPSAASGGVLEMLAGLIDKSLLLRVESSEPARPLYGMLETVRAYAALELGADDERDDALDGLARYCAVEAARAATELEGPAQVEWLNRVRHDLENYRAAMSWLIAGGRADEASGIAWGLKYFWMIRGHAAEGTQWYEQILGAPSLSAGGESRGLVGAAGMWFAQGDFARARTALDRALALTRGAGDVEIVAQAEYTSAHIERASGNLTGAREGFSRSLERFHRLNLRAGMGKALVGLATVAFEAGDFDHAERLAGESASVLSDSGPWFLCFGLWIRALLAVRRNNADEAIALVRENLVHIRELHDTFAFVYAVIPLAAAAVLKDDPAWAARILGVRDAVAERTAATIIDGSVHDLRGQTERDVRARLGHSRWDKAYAAGRVSSLDSILKDVDQVLADTKRS